MRVHYRKVASSCFHPPLLKHYSSMEIICAHNSWLSMLWLMFQICTRARQCTRYSENTNIHDNTYWSVCGVRSMPLTGFKPCIYCWLAFIANWMPCELTVTGIRTTGIIFLVFVVVVLFSSELFPNKCQHCNCAHYQMTQHLLIWNYFHTNSVFCDVMFIPNVRYVSTSMVNAEY